MKTIFSNINTAQYQLAYSKLDSDVLNQCRCGERRELEKEQIRLLFERLGLDYSLLTYNPHGKPEYPEIQLSITHSAGWYAVAVAETPIGIDIEAYRESLNEGSDYFVNSREIEQKDRLAIWTAKEAFYKLFGGEIRDFKEDVTLLQQNENQLVIEYENRKYSGDLYVIEDVYLVVFFN